VINLKRKVTTSKTAPKPGALKPVRNLLGKAAKGSRLQKPSKAALLVPRHRSVTPVSSSEDESPNITPASLRSANKKATQSQKAIKPLKPLKLSKTSRLGQRTLEVPDSESELESDSEEEEVPDSDIDAEYGKAVAKSKFQGKKKGSASAPRGIHKTGAGVAKISRGRVRNSRGRYEKKKA
jgi:palmitoyltransferase ZDHHC9/14/18